MNLDIEYKLSLYEELKSIYKSKKVEIFLVQNIQDDKIYIKKELKEYTKEVYEGLKNIESINMPRVYEIFELDEKLIIIEEFINGDTLQAILEKNNKLDEQIVIKYIISLCDILSKIHNLDPPIIHRDIKPSNIIISNDNVLKLIDFDIARTYKDGENLDTTLLGTKGYASPEQFGFDQTDCRSDIYAIGIMMNVLTTGKHIKEEENNGTLKNIIKKCTNISADKRYQSVEELRKDLEMKIYKKEIEIKIKKEYKEEKILKYIPGFRRGNIIFMILASAWYLFLLVGLFIHKNTAELITNILVVITLLSIYLIYTNFLNIKEKLPIIRSNKKITKIFGYWLYTIVIILLCGVLMSLFE
ncbi:protein kinase [Clostridium sp. CCUG 7971]|uniref:protein kinase domain-containing protein n=1 Tax=Clostridium sp. CCUG 7971 TaxID=2811414 RepID=UPI001ABB919A|nr:protein kinase [Clostridium sp. CCUG 7971]MBO3444521.1 protein kinase [Clostridium sp. CCUG 7971]